MKYICTSCGHHFYKYQDRASHPCTECDGTAWWKDSSKHGGGIAILGKYAEVTAFGVDEKGRQVGITTKGKRVDPSKTRYDLKRDPKGWKAIGKKVRSKDQYGNPNY